MKPILIAGLMIMSSSLCYAEVETSSAFLGEDAQAPKAQAFYQARCQALASENTSLTSETLRAQYLTDCMNDMAVVWPLGYDESE